MKPAPEWSDEGRDWPNRASSRFVPSGGLDWHVQTMGTGPTLLLLHGTGAATHSWRDLAPLLASSFTVVGLDLPGHGFTNRRGRRELTLPGMAAAVGTLLETLSVAPAFAAGHSAGAAVALRMALDGHIAPDAIVGFNAALTPFPGIAARLFPALAQVIVMNPFAGPFLARRAADPRAVERLIVGTGSHIDARGLDFYARLMRTVRHVESCLGMMAGWDLATLHEDLPRLRTRLTLIACEGDRAVPPDRAALLAGRVPGARAVTVERLGHLGHEEDPARFAALVRDACVQP